ncbi:DUF5117 domain-containing protein [Paraflavitalea soli]|uniref:DUF5117 domain-containing protein n=1 Tax=Paraflavitalea soli TaxID=2315862 RepID=A0A3B7MPU2_9BACT|nr:zinc-dependent metalloprotease [Paraflavitalea soli]AXY72661.1 DUF5117 domain-containing protein [Paraflavitalea soli]
MTVIRNAFYCLVLLVIVSCQESRSVANGQRPVTAMGKTVIKDSLKTFLKASAVADEGVFTIYRDSAHYYFEIKDSLLNRDFLVVNRVSQAPAMGPEPSSRRWLYAGDIIGEQVIRFEKGPNNKLFLKKVYFEEMSRDSSENGLFEAVSKSSFLPIVYSFDIKDTGRHGGMLIDVTDVLSADNDIFFFSSGMKKLIRLGGLERDRSYISKVSSFPLNVEIKAVKTYAGVDGGTTSYELNSSIVILPERPMIPRYSDARIGYFVANFYDYDLKKQSVNKSNIITRWRLEVKDGDWDKYKAGILVEPKKPIVFYIDPTTPKKWVPYLIQGVNDWQRAFEKAGFKNAIYALEAPVNDEEWSIEDARHNAIVYKPSTTMNASGPHVHDPRSGEIIESHINWYHNVLKLLRNWYFIQASAIDPQARFMEFSDTLMGNLIRFVSSHEVGHTLGLMHNFGASSTVPVDSLRNKKWVEKNGHTPSIMDYARFNYVAQPEDSIGEAGIFPRIGKYDEWAIEWGYRQMPALTEKQEIDSLNKWIVTKVDSDPKLYFGYETDEFNPKAQSEDLGDNAMQANRYGIENLKRIAKNLVSWTTKGNENYDDLAELYPELIAQYKRYLFHVATYIGGQVHYQRSPSQPGPRKVFVPMQKQQEALAFLKDQIFSTPQWLVDVDKGVFPLIGGAGFGNVSKIQADVLEKIMSHAIFCNLLWAQSNTRERGYSLDNYLADLRGIIWSELKSNKPIDMYRRNLQKLYVERLSILINFKTSANRFEANGPFSQTSISTDILSILKGEVRALRSEIGISRNKATDKLSKLHLIDLWERLGTIIDDGSK